MKLTNGIQFFDNVPLFLEKHKEELDKISPGITDEDVIQVIKGFYGFLFDNMEGKHLTTMRITHIGTFKPMTMRIASHLTSLLRGVESGKITKDFFNLSLAVAHNYFERTGYSTTKIKHFKYL